jgi:twitching motility protein PilT
LPRIGKGRIAAIEILIANQAVRNLIREGKTFQLLNVMQLGNGDGMRTRDQALIDLIRRDIVPREEALLASSNPEKISRPLPSAIGVA